MAAKNAPGTPGWLGAVNDRTALALLLEHPVLTRNRIGELSGLSKPTASQIVSRLEEAGLVYVSTQITGGRGPHAAGYSVRADRTIGVAIDITATTIHATVADVSATEHPIVSIPVAEAHERSAINDIRSAIDAACTAANSNPDVVRRVLVGVQGSIDPRSDELSFAETLPGWPRTGVRGHLEQELQINVAIDNDANLAAIAERTQGASAEEPGFALIWMGNGLGVSIDQNGALLRGAAGGAGEIGYLPVPISAARIDPVAQDLQDLMGGPTVSRILRTNGVPGRTLDDRLAQLNSAPPEIRTAVLTELAPRIAHGVLPVLAVLDPGTIVLGGPTGMAGGAVLAELVRTQIRRTTRWSPNVVATTIESHPVLRGARAALVAELRASLLDEVAAQVLSSTQ